MQFTMLGWPMKSKEQKKWRMRNEPKVAEYPVFDLDSGGFLIFHKDPENHCCEYRQGKSSAGQHHPYSVFKCQEGHDFGETAVSQRLCTNDLSMPHCFISEKSKEDFTLNNSCLFPWHNHYHIFYHWKYCPPLTWFLDTKIMCHAGEPLSIIK